MTDPVQAAQPEAEQPSIFDRPLPDGYRDELRTLAAERFAEPSRRQGSLVHFQLGQLRLALPTRVAAAVAPVLHIARIPHRSSTVLLGLAAFRGDILPCCSLARILDVAQAETNVTRTLILEEAPGRRWAVPIDGVLGVRLADSEPITCDLPVSEQWISGSFQDDAGIFHLLDHEVLFRQITLATA